MAYPINIAIKMNWTYIRTPFAATPSEPAYLRSWKLYTIPTMDEAVFDTNSEAPFQQARAMLFISSFVRTILSRLLLGRIKYINGIIPPTTWHRPVAIAAPATPHFNTPTSSASSTMFVRPATTVVTRPRCGFSAVIKNP